MSEFLRQHYQSQPYEVSIETLALCNAACTFCPYPTLVRKGVKLSDVLIASLIGQMSSWTIPFFISPFKVNEPLLDARLQAICEKIEREVPHATLRLFTNGQPLTPTHVEWIGKLKRVASLWVSLNSCDPVEYERLMSVRYSIVKRNLDFLHSLVAKWRTTIFPHPVVVSRVMSSDGPIPDSKDHLFLTAARRAWPEFEARLIKRDSWLGYTTPSHPSVPRTACSRWWELNITAEGKAVLCCMDGKGEYVLGDCVQQPLLEIYNQPVLAHRRRSVLTREGVVPCKQCSY